MHDEPPVDVGVRKVSDSSRSWLVTRPAPAAAPPTAARFALSAAILPRLEDALAVGERIRMALLRCSDGHPVFVGRDSMGQPARCHHHAWFLPADDDADGAIDHVVVYAPGGFDHAAQRALEQLRLVWGHPGSTVGLAMVKLGWPYELGCLRKDAARRGLSAQLGAGRIWESLTPFVPPRHSKVRGGVVRDAPHDQVARLLALHGLPAAQVEPLAAGEITPPRPASPISWDRFRRVRASGHGSRGADRAFGFRLRFERPVMGPIALGYGAHQGLGQFVAIE